MKPPYYAVIFTSVRTTVDDNYVAVNDALEEMAAQLPGFLGIESMRDAERFGISVSYWADEAAIAHWAKTLEHREAKAMGHSQWFESYTIRIAKVESERNFTAP